MPKITPIGPSGVAIPIALRAAQQRPERVRALVKSIRHEGASLGPVTVWEHDGGIGYMLVDGLHELLAAKVLKLESIPAIVVPKPARAD